MDGPFVLGELPWEFEQDGWFDKDEQGWCSTRIRAHQEGNRLFVRQWHDANGVIRSDSTLSGQITAVDEHRVTLTMDDGQVRFYERKTARVVKE